MTKTIYQLTWEQNGETDLRYGNFEFCKQLLVDYFYGFYLDCNLAFAKAKGEEFMLCETLQDINEVIETLEHSNIKIKMIPII